MQKSVPSKDVKFFFERRTCVSRGVKVPCTRAPDEFAWVHACTKKVQSCRQVAAVNTVIFHGNLDRELLSSWGRPQATSVAFSSQVQSLEPDRKIWTLVPCSFTVPDDVYPKLSQDVQI